MRLVTAPPKSAQIAEMIKGRISSGEIKPGERLGSVRDIAEKFGVGRQVVLSAFETLEREKLVKGEVGRGTFVLPPAPKNRRLRLGLWFNGGDLTHASHSLLFFRMAGKAAAVGNDLILGTAPDRLSIGGWAEKNSLDGVMATGLVDDRLVGEMKKMGRPFIVLGNYSLSVEVPRVEIDMSPMGGAVKTVLEKFSSKNAGMITSSRSLIATRQLEEQLKKGVAGAGLSIHDSLFRASETEDGYKEMKWLMEKSKIRPDFLYVTAQALVGAAKYVFEKGLQGGRKPRMMMFSTAEEKAEYPELVDVILEGRPDFGEKGMELLAKIIQNPGRKNMLSLPFSGKIVFGK